MGFWSPDQLSFILKPWSPCSTQTFLQADINEQMVSLLNANFQKLTELQKTLARKHKMTTTPDPEIAVQRVAD